MKKIQELIKGQTIRIDNHHRLTQQDWLTNTDVHLHKVHKEHKGKVYEIRIPLNSQKDVSVHCCGNPIEEVPTFILKEVREALNDTVRRKRFIKEVYEVLMNDFRWEKNSKEGCEEVMAKIAQAFQMKFTSDTESKDNVSYRKMTDGYSEYQIVFNYERECFYIGECLDGWEPELLDF